MQIEPTTDVHQHRPLPDTLASPELAPRGLGIQSQAETPTPDQGDVSKNERVKLSVIFSLE